MEEVEVVARWSFNSNIFLELRFSRLRISPAPATLRYGTATLCAVWTLHSRFPGFWFLV